MMTLGTVIFGSNPCYLQYEWSNKPPQNSIHSGPESKPSHLESPNTGEFSSVPKSSKLLTKWQGPFEVTQLRGKRIEVIHFKYTTSIS